jgi:hypothetical protein
MPRLTKLLAAIALSGSAFAPAAEPVVVLEADPIAADAIDVQVDVDGTALRNGALLARPTSIFADPDTADTRAHVAEQLALWRQHEPEMPDLVGLLTGTDALRFLGAFPEEPGSGRHREMDIGFLIQGAAASAMHAWLGERVAEGNGTKSTLDGFEGWSDNGIFAAFKDDTWVATAPNLLAALTAPVQADSATPVKLRVAGKDLMGLMALMAEFEDEIDPVMSGIIPDWKDSEPVLTGSLQADAEGWRGNLLLEGFDHPALATISPELAKRALPGQEFSVLASVAPAQAFELFLVFAAAMERDPPDRLRKQVDAGLLQVTGLGLDEHLKQLSGGLVAQGGWAKAFGPIPDWVVSMELNEGNGVAEVLGQLMPMANANEVAVEGADAAWFVPTPIGGITVAIGPGVLTASNRDTMVASALAGGHEVISVPAGSMFHLDADMQALGRRWIPFAWMQLQSMEEELGRSLSDRISTVVWRAREALDAEEKPTTVSKAILGGGNEGRWVRRSLGPMFPDQDLAKAVDEHLSLWKTDENRGGDGLAVVYRTEAGWSAVVGWRDERGPFRTVEELRAELSDFARVLGKAPPEQALLSMPERPVFDVRWLPTLDVLFEHIPDRWTATLSRTEQGLVLDERGLPPLTALSGFFASITIGLAEDIERNLHRRRVNEKEREFRSERPELFEAMEAISTAIQSWRSQQGGDLPEKASELVLQGYLDLKDVAGFFGGVVPKAPSAVDAIGRWSSEQEGWPWAALSVRIDDTWTVNANPGGGVDVSDAFEVPPAIDPAAAQVEPTAAEQAAMKDLLGDEEAGEAVDAPDDGF